MVAAAHTSFPAAMARRNWTGFAPTFTMRAAPAALRWEKFFNLYFVAAGVNRLISKPEKV
jgi:hypothetical protein